MFHCWSPNITMQFISCGTRQSNFKPWGYNSQVGYPNTSICYKIKIIFILLCWKYMQLLSQLRYTLHVHDRSYIGLLLPRRFQNTRGILVLGTISLSFAIYVWVHIYNPLHHFAFVYSPQFDFLVSETFEIDSGSESLSLPDMETYNKPIYWLYQYFRGSPVLILLGVLLVLYLHRQRHFHNYKIEKQHFLLLT